MPDDFRAKSAKLVKTFHSKQGIIRGKKADEAERRKEFFDQFESKVTVFKGDGTVFSDFITAFTTAATDPARIRTSPTPTTPANPRKSWDEPSASTAPGGCWQQNAPTRQGRGPMPAACPVATSTTPSRPVYGAST